MAIARKPRPAGRMCTTHCFVWVQSGISMRIECSHCPAVRAVLHLAGTTPLEMRERIAHESRTQHARLCGRRETW